MSDGRNWREMFAEPLHFPFWGFQKAAVSLGCLVLSSQFDFAVFSLLILL